jgi:hypothetical protein
MRYYLTHPTNPQDHLKLPFGQKTVFKSVAGNDYFLLSLVGTGRALTPYDPPTDTTFGNPSAVPNDWDGEPFTYSIDGGMWDNLLDLRAQGDAVATGVVDDLEHRILSGDFLAIRRAGQPTTYRIQRRGAIVETQVSPYP